MKFSNFCVPGVGFLTPFSVPKGGFLYTMIVQEKGFLLPSSRVLGGGGGGGEVVMDEIDTCINCQTFIKHVN